MDSVQLAALADEHKALAKSLARMAAKLDALSRKLPVTESGRVMSDAQVSAKVRARLRRLEER